MQNIPDTIAKTIDVLAEKFGETGINLWNIMVTGTYYQSLIGTIVSIVCLFAGIFSVYKAVTYKTKDWQEKEEIQMLFWTSAFITLIISFVAFLTSNPIGIFAPEFVLLQSLIR